MIIIPDRLKKAAKAAKVDAEALAAALPKPTSRRKQDELALKKVTNWMNGRNHPRAKPQEVAALAGALGVEARSLVRFTCTSRFVRSAPRKARLVVDLVRGKRVDEAQALLQFSPKRAAIMVGKALMSAIAQAEQADAAVDQLYITDGRVDDSVQIKRFQPKDRGRAHPIIKRTCHITIGVEERA